jgi:D-sedoheptulose 7-phosphate isomerase
MKSDFDPTEMFESALAEHVEVAARQQGVIEVIGLAMNTALVGGGKILWCGNGGSAADCQHLAMDADSAGRVNHTTD